MFSPTLLISVALYFHTVQARNDILIHGWAPEPSGRGTWSILWGCLATIFICTWSALHLDVPKKHGRWYLFFRKLGWMFIAVMAPEAIVALAAKNFFNARDLSNHLHSQGHQTWTLVHTQFAYANGFRTRTPLGEESESKCEPEQLRNLIERRDIDGPPISEDELKSRGKSDWVIKLIAVAQIIWFVVQTLIRAIHHYHTTPLEIMTVAFVFCSVFIYGFSLNRPQDVEYPVLLEVSDAALLRSGTASTADTETLTTDEAKPDRRSDISVSTEEGDEASSTRSRARSVTLRLNLSSFVPGWAASTVPDILLQIFACSFGALHCLAWNSQFPTLKEQLAWRICSATTTGVPAFVLLLTYVSKLYNIYLSGILTRSLIRLLLPLWFPLYVIGRITIVVLAFTSLRALPADAFRTIDWNSYIPHFAA